MPDAAPALICEFHDLHPGSREACERFLAGLATRGIRRASLLVVPCWHGRDPFSRDAAFVTWLHERAREGHDLCLHGYYHRADAVTGGMRARLTGRVYTAGEGEYFQISREEALARLERGLMCFREAGLPVYGFTPPAWLLSAAGRAALRERGFHYNTAFRVVELLQQQRRLTAPTVLMSCRSLWRRAVSRFWCRWWLALHRHSPLLRLAAHPVDFQYASMERYFWRLAGVAARAREVMTFRDLAGPLAQSLTV